MPVLPPRLPPPFDVVLDGVGRAFEGDADAISEVVAQDVSWRDDEDDLAGVDEVLGHFLAHGGWRERFHVAAVEQDGDDWVVRWTLWLRADATSLRRDGRARVRLRDDLIATWEATASEHVDGSLAAWGED